jgi:phosphopentomutase
LGSEDLVVITADHGCDPTASGTEHTREQIPILSFGPGVEARAVGQRKTYADIAATVAEHLLLRERFDAAPF